MAGGGPTARDRNTSAAPQNVPSPDLLCRNYCRTHKIMRVSYQETPDDVPILAERSEDLVLVSAIPDKVIESDMPLVRRLQPDARTYHSTVFMSISGCFPRTLTPWRRQMRYTQPGRTHHRSPLKGALIRRTPYLLNVRPKIQSR